MFIINKFDSYRDGGTVSMNCRIGGPIWDKYIKTETGKEVEICIDGRFGKYPTIWIGYPEKKESILIEDSEIIKHIISRVEDYKRITNHKMDSFIDFEENVRDWKIKNIINK
jgi:hypothetical protein